MDFVITQAHIDACLKAGACSVPYRAGTMLCEVSQSDLLWVERNVPSIAKSIAKDVGLPLWTCSGYGDGSSYGYGSGYGSGSGYGDGYGYGYGYSYGYGYGSGSSRE